MLKQKTNKLLYRFYGLALSGFFFATLTLSTALNASLNSPVDEIMRKAFWDSSKGFPQKDRHKRKVTSDKNNYTVTVEFDYETAPPAIKEAAEKVIEAQDAKASETKSWSWKSPLLP